MLAIWSLVPLPFLNPAWRSGSSWFMYCWSLAYIIFRIICSNFSITLLACESCSVMSNSLWSHGLYSPWNSPGQNTGVSSLSLLQRIFPTQGLNPGLPHCRQILYQLSHKGSIWEECTCAVVWAFFGIAFLWDWNENWSFPVLWLLLSFPNLLAYWVQHFHSIIF